MKMMGSEERSIQDLYKLKDVDDLTRFVKERDGLNEILMDAPSHIRGRFPESRLLLHVEEMDGGRVLVLTIVTRMDGDEAFDVYDLLLDSWWLEIDQEVRADVVLEVDFY